MNVVNKTMPDYKLIFGPAIHDRGFIVHNVTAHLPCNTTAMTVVPGYAGCEDPSTGGKDVCNAISFADDPSPDVPARLPRGEHRGCRRKHRTRRSC